MVSAAPGASGSPPNGTAATIGITAIFLTSTCRMERTAWVLRSLGSNCSTSFASGRLEFGRLVHPQSPRSIAQAADRSAIVFMGDILADPVQTSTVIHLPVRKRQLLIADLFFYNTSSDPQIHTIGP